MNHLQPAPKRQVLAIRQEFINLRRTVTQRFSPDGLQPPAPAVDSLIRIVSVNMGLFVGMREDPCPAPVRNPGEIAGVVQMAVREQNGLERLRCQLESSKQPPEVERLAGQPG